MSLTESYIAAETWSDITKPLFGIDVFLLTSWFLFCGLIPAIYFAVIHWKKSSPKLIIENRQTELMNHQDYNMQGRPTDMTVSSQNTPID